MNCINCGSEAEVIGESIKGDRLWFCRVCGDSNDKLQRIWGLWNEAEGQTQYKTPEKSVRSSKRGHRRK